jgi:hypothetical protein
MKAFCLAALVGSSLAQRTHTEIKPVTKAFQMGKFPYLRNGSTNTVATEQACMDQCMTIPDCKFGTFVTAAADSPEGTHAYSHTANYGECWLSATTHDEPVACGVPCKGFQKVEVNDPEPTTRAPRLDQSNEMCTCVATMAPEVYMRCMTSCIAHGLHTYTRSACKCNPTDAESLFTTCHQDAFSAHIMVDHLQPRFHTEPMNGGEQHRCMMVSDTKCACCDCHNTGYYSIREIGFGMHTAAAPFIEDPAPVVGDMHACQEMCHDHGDLCRAGTFITEGPSAGQCWLSHNIERAQQCSDEKPCASFVHVTHDDINYEAGHPELKGPDHRTRGISSDQYQDRVLVSKTATTPYPHANILSDANKQQFAGHEVGLDKGAPLDTNSHDPHENDLRARQHWDAQAAGSLGTGTTRMDLTGFDGTRNLAGKHRLDFVHLEGDMYMIKDGANCLIFGGSGNNKHPQYYNWGNGNDYCGFPDNGGGNKASLLANGQAIFRVDHLEGDKYTIKYAQNGKCLIYGSSGSDTEVQRYLWNTNAAYADTCGFSDVATVVANKQAVFTLTTV